MAQLQQAIRLAPRASRPHTAPGNIYREGLPQTVDAEREYCRAMALDAADWLPLENLAMLLRYDTKDLRGAQALFRQVLCMNRA